VSQVTENPFVYSDTNKRYHTYDYYLRHKFSEKCAKITLDAGFTCPNIDGSRGVGGCIYCSGGSRSAGCDGLLPLITQYESQKKQILSKWTVSKFIPYLQAYTNSYTSPENFEKILNEISDFDGAVMIDIATRADCLEDEKIKILDRVSEKIPVTVELGLQSSNDDTAKRINRCHTYEEFTDCFARLRKNAPCVKIAVHIINGLPGESREDMIRTLCDVDGLYPDILKIHLLHVIKDTPLGKMYEMGAYTPLEKDEYVGIVCDQLELLSPDIVVERVTGDGLKDSLLAPLWSLKKTSVINDIDKELYNRGTYQGAKRTR
jgi:radical SAM protein (TIGR01212 family)